MLNENGFSRMELILKEFAKLDKENLTGPDEKTDPRVAELIREGESALKQLDPIVRETFRDNPEALAEWDSIMHMNDDLDEEDPGKSDK